MLKQGIVTWLGRPEDAGFEISRRFFFQFHLHKLPKVLVLVDATSEIRFFLVRWHSTLERLPWWLGRTEALGDFEMWKVDLQLFGPFRVYLEVWCCCTCFCVLMLFLDVLISNMQPSDNLRVHLLHLGLKFWMKITRYMWFFWWSPAVTKH